MYSRALPLTYLGAPRLLPVRRGGVGGARRTYCGVLFAGWLAAPEHDLYLN